MSTIPSALNRFQRAMVSRRNDHCGFCGAQTFAGTDFAVLNDGKWMGVCVAHAMSTVEQCKALVLMVQAEASGLNEQQMAAIDAHCPANLEDILKGNGTAAETLQTAAALTSAVNVARHFKTLDAPAPVRSNRFGGKCGTCGVYVAEGQGRIERNDAGKWITFHLDGKCSEADIDFTVPEDSIDLTPLKAFTSKGICRFGVPGGDTRLKVRVNFHTNGVIYVNDCAVYGERQNYGQQRPGQAYKGKIEDALRAILADPKGAVIRYAELTSCCGVCNLPLEDADSVARGMGPVCAAKFG